MKVIARRSETNVLDEGTKKYVVFEFLQDSFNYVLTPTLETDITFLHPTEKGVHLINLSGTHWGTSKENQEKLKQFLASPNEKELIF